MKEYDYSYQEFIRLMWEDYQRNNPELFEQFNSEFEQTTDKTSPVLKRNL